MSELWMFPGQGSQAVGMGKALAEAFPVAKAVFDEVDDCLNQKLSAIMFEGPEAELTLTENAQPALMAVSIAVVRVLEQEGNYKLAQKAKYVAGHSLGEYSALAAAGTFSLADAARLLKIRGKAMQAAVPVGVGAMAAILGLDLADVLAIATAASTEKEFCEVANDNSAGQVVISGHRAAVERAMELAKAKGAKRALALPVSAPFHCKLMAPAADAMADALANVKINAPLVPVIANVTCSPLSDPLTIRDALIKQVCGTVRWRESMSFAGSALGVQRFVELGSGKVLAGLIKRIVDGSETMSLSSPQEIDAFLKGAQ